MSAEAVVVIAVVVAAFAFFGGLLGWATSIAGPSFPGYGKAAGSDVQASRPRSVALAH